MHIGEILWEDFMEPLSISQAELARALMVPANRVSGILKGLREISVDTDLRLCKFFGLSDGYFLRMQAELNITKAKERTEAGHILEKIKVHHSIQTEA